MDHATKPKESVFLAQVHHKTLKSFVEAYQSSDSCTLCGNYDRMMDYSGHIRGRRSHRKERWRHSQFCWGNASGHTKSPQTHGPPPTIAWLFLTGKTTLMEFLRIGLRITYQFRDGMGTIHAETWRSRPGVSRRTA